MGARLIISLIRGYQILVSPFLGNRCRFYPSCSQYAIECYKKYTLHMATFRSILRVIRCNPMHSGGVDLP